jgi:hypothetical protein
MEPTHASPKACAVARRLQRRVRCGPGWAMVCLRPERSTQDGHHCCNDVRERFGF